MSKLDPKPKTRIARIQAKEVRSNIQQQTQGC